MKIAKQFVNLINKRDNLMKKHCNGASFAELCNYPEERAWYCENIMQYDKKIIKLANELIEKLNLPCQKQKSLRDVYSNPHLDEIYKKYSKPQTKEK